MATVMVIVRVNKGLGLEVVGLWLVRIITGIGFGLDNPGYTVML